MTIEKQTNGPGRFARNFALAECVANLSPGVLIGIEEAVAFTGFPPSSLRNPRQRAAIAFPEPLEGLGRHLKWTAGSIQRWSHSFEKIFTTKGEKGNRTTKPKLGAPSKSIQVARARCAITQPNTSFDAIN